MTSLRKDDSTSLKVIYGIVGVLTIAVFSAIYIFHGIPSDAHHSVAQKLPST